MTTKTKAIEPVHESGIIEADVVANPQKVMDNAIRASKVLKDVVSKSSNKSIIVVNNHEYLMFSAWQTIAQFYGFTSQCEQTERLTEGGKFLGYKAKAVLINLMSGQTFPGAEAICLAEEQNWRGKPEYALLSMAQTRANSKTLSNKFRWVATLAGYEGTPGEEIVDVAEQVFGAKAESTREGGSDGRPATPQQLKYIHKNFTWKKLSEAEFEEKYKRVDDLTLDEAKTMLDFLFNKENKSPKMDQVLALFGANTEVEPEVSETVEDIIDKIPPTKPLES